MYTVTQIELAIIKELKSKLKGVLHVDSLGEFLIDETEKKRGNLTKVHVVYGKASYTDISGAKDKHMIFTVMVKGSNPKGEEQARHGTKTKKGVYEILDDIRDILTGNKCGLENISVLQPVFEGAIGGTATSAVYGIDFKTMSRHELTA